MAPAAKAEPDPSAAPRSAATTVLLTVAYDGRGYAGMVVQKNAVTVGEHLLDAIHRFDPTVAKLRVASRTDSGVHACDQRVAFDTVQQQVPMRGWVLGLSQRLPSAIAVRRAARVGAGFVPRHRTIEKRYRYLVLSDRLGDPFLAGRAWRAHDLPPAAQAAQTMRQELAAALGTHDFAAFASSRDRREHTVRTMTRIEVSIVDRPVQALGGPANLLAIDITGDGFLHNMVRILVGTAVDVARGRLPAGAIARAIASGRRRDLGVTAPPDGLYLDSVTLDLQPGEELDAWP